LLQRKSSDLVFTNAQQARDKNRAPKENRVRWLQIPRTTRKPRPLKLNGTGRAAATRMTKNENFSHGRVHRQERQAGEESWHRSNKKNRPLGLHTAGLRCSQRNQLKTQSRTCTGPREQQASEQNLAGNCEKKNERQDVAGALGRTSGEKPNFQLKTPSLRSSAQTKQQKGKTNNTLKMLKSFFQHT
jgi:hypothetical protein